MTDIYVEEGVFMNLYTMEDLYEFNEDEHKVSNNDSFQLHTHNEYEIYMFMAGDSDYVVENKMYDLEPGDMIIIRKNEMHRVHHKRECDYKRMVIMVSPEYFKNYGCQEYEKIFIDSSLDNKISVDMAKKIGLSDAIARLWKYYKLCKRKDAPVIISTITEILYLINEVSDFKPSAIEPPLIKRIMNYIITNLSSDISLDTLANEFYVSKYHLCNIFKKFTGLTIGEYITQKRLSLADDLVKKGENLGNAASKAGFKNYSSFFRAYMRRHNKNPRMSKQA